MDLPQDSGGTSLTCRREVTEEEAGFGDLRFEPEDGKFCTVC